DRNDDRRRVPGPHESVLRARRAVEVIPRAKPALLAFHDQRALPLEYQKALLSALPVVQPDRLPRRENADVETELREPPLPFEGAVRAERAVVAPPRVAGVQHEPAIALRRQAVPGLTERRLGGHEGNTQRTAVFRMSSPSQKSTRAGSTANHGSSG